MKKCPCGKEFRLGPGYGHNRLFDSHCSRYCKIYFEDPDKYPKVLKSSSKHHKNHWKKPKIEVSCDVCENPVKLEPYEKEGNKHFCSKLCWQSLVTTKKGMVHWTVLKIVKLYGPISAQGVAGRYCTNNTIMTSRTAANHLKLFRARGIIEMINPPIENLSSPATYQVITDLPLGMVVKDKIKLNS
jgi:hypothetical protein